jgi:sodium/hydrogen exchanger 8
MPQDDAQVEKRWTGGELLVCAVIQLLLVHVAYRIDRMKGAPYISSPSWAIIFGLGVRMPCASHLYRSLNMLFVSMEHCFPSHGIRLVNLHMLHKYTRLIFVFELEKRARDAGLDPQILFFGLLPPIILEAGFNTQRKGFFSNFLAICLLAIVGTLIATFVTGGIMVWLEKMGLVTNIPPAEAFLFGSLISAIDPVATLLVLKKCHTPPLLFNLVFGESVLNDAIGRTKRSIRFLLFITHGILSLAIVLYGLFQKFSLQGRTDFSFESMVKMSVELLGVGFGSVVFAAAVCYASAFLLRVSVLQYCIKCNFLWIHHKALFLFSIQILRFVSIQPMKFRLSCFQPMEVM